MFDMDIFETDLRCFLLHDLLSFTGSINNISHYMHQASTVKATLVFE
jgi:hypothetical protein